MVAANAAVDDYIKALPKLDTDLNSATAAATATATNVVTYLDTAEGLMAAGVNDAFFADRSDAIQDALITAATAAKAKALATALKAAEAGSADLAAEVNAQIALTNAADDADAEAQEAYDDEETAYEAVNGAVTTNFDLDTDTGVVTFSQGAGDLASNATGAWVLTALGKTAAAAGDMKGYADLFAAYDANASAEQALVDAKQALGDAVEAVYLNENGGYSALRSDINATISNANFGIPGAEADYEVDFGTDVKIFATKALADIDAAGVKASFKVLFLTNGSGGSLDFSVPDGAGNTVVAHADGAAGDVLAAAVKLKVYTDWIVTAGDTDFDVIFTAREAGPQNPATTTPNVSTVSSPVAGTEPDIGTGFSADVDAALTGEVADAQFDIDAFAEAVAAFQDARSINNDIADLQDAIDAADEALTDPVADGGLGVTLIDGASNFSVKNEVYVFDADQADATLSNFGKTGEDKIFFGADYSLVALGTTAITKSVGDVAALEVFWQQVGTSLVLYVETESYGGSSTTTGDIVQITLTGTKATDITFADGIMSNGTAVA